MVFNCFSGLIRYWSKIGSFFYYEFTLIELKYFLFQCLTSICLWILIILMDLFLPMNLKVVLIDSFMNTCNILITVLLLNTIFARTMHYLYHYKICAQYFFSLLFFVSFSIRNYKSCLTQLIWYFVLNRINNPKVKLTLKQVNKIDTE